MSRSDNTVESYEFGCMVINGRRYKKDLIVFPDEIIENWWRKEGHRVDVEDLERVLSVDPPPETLVIGTGFSGLVKVSSRLKEIAAARGIKLVAQPTSKAVSTYNQLLEENREALASRRNLVIGAFHLTC